MQEIVTKYFAAYYQGSLQWTKLNSICEFNKK